VLEQDLYSLGGEALVLVYPKKEGKVTSIVGQGWAPKGVDVDYFTSRGKTLEGAGLDPAVVPGALHAALTVLEKWGTMSFADVSARAIRVRGRWIPASQQHGARHRAATRFLKKWPDNQKYWLKADGTTYKPGETIKLPTLARTLKRMVEAERAAKSKGRAAGIVAARDRFYKGDIAKEMVAFLQQHGAPFDQSDFAEYFARVEEPAKTTYRGYTVYKHSFTSQGPVLLQALNILENFDLHSMRHDSADYIHTVIESLKLAYADRDTYYADTRSCRFPVKDCCRRSMRRSARGWSIRRSPRRRSSPAIR
jgi:gamma-glutamyltranspeptidase/glutathione hydrolase